MSSASTQPRRTNSASTAHSGYATPCRSTVERVGALVAADPGEASTAAAAPSATAISKRRCWQHTGILKPRILAVPTGTAGGQDHAMNDQDESVTDRHERRRVEAMALQAEFDAVEADGQDASVRGDTEAVQRAQDRKRELIDALRALSGGPAMATSDGTISRPTS